MSEMIERVAMALFERARNREFAEMLYGKPPCPWELIVEGAKDEFRAEARAAIEAMREPTDAMEIEGHGTAIDVDGSTHIVSAVACWRAMIDAALVSE